jgi:hypothetical protein
MASASSSRVMGVPYADLFMGAPLWIGRPER